MSKKGQIYRKYSSEFKISVIMDMRKNHLGLMETERKYNVDHHTIARWERIYLEPVHIKIASKIIAKVRFPKYRTSSLS